MQSKINKIFFFGAFLAILINIGLFGVANVIDSFDLKILSIINIFLLSTVLFRNADELQ